MLLRQPNAAQKHQGLLWAVMIKALQADKCAGFKTSGTSLSDIFFSYDL